MSKSERSRGSDLFIALKWYLHIDISCTGEASMRVCKYFYIVLPYRAELCRNPEKEPWLVVEWTNKIVYTQHFFAVYHCNWQCRV